jgi:hypothetical protein
MAAITARAFAVEKIVDAEIFGFNDISSSESCSSRLLSTWKEVASLF